MSELEALQQQIRDYADERDWDQFHSPKNLVMALSVEASELLEHFQWLTEEESQALGTEKRAQVAAEMSDVLVYLLRLSDKLDIDLLAAVQQKMVENAEKYPADKVRGSSRKYTEY